MRRITNTRKITIGGNRTIGQVITRSGYEDYAYSILERCVLMRGPKRKVRISVFSIEHFDHEPTDEEIEAEYIWHNLKRPAVDHAIHFGNQKRDLPVEENPIIFYLKVPFSVTLGHRDVLLLRRNCGDRGLRWCRLDPSNRWPRNCRFAGIRE